MTQPGSATVTSAASSALPAGPVAVARTGSTVPGCGCPENSTGTSAVTSAPGVRPVRTAASGVPTCCPCTVTATAVCGLVIMPGPALVTVTLTICSARAAVPPNRSVEATPL